MKKMAFIGTGVMGGALARAACKGCDPKDIVVTDYDSEKARAFAEETGAEYVATNAEAVKSSKFILIGVKPQVGEAVLSEIGPVVKECIENGWYIINHFYSRFSEYSQLNKDAEDADDFLLYVEKRLGDPNEIHVCDTDDAYDHIECCNYQSTDGITHATMYYYYVYKYTDRTLVVQVREYYTLDENLNITDVDYEEADSIGLEQYYCPSGFDLSKHRILSTIRSFG